MTGSLYPAPSSSLRDQESARGDVEPTNRWPIVAAPAIGVTAAFAFEPVGLWPLMLAAFALLSELLVRTPSLTRALLIGWLFGLGQFVVGLNWIATAFTYQAAMPSWLGWVAVVLLSLYLAVYPALAAGVAWSLGGGRPGALVLALAGVWGITEWLRAGIFTGFAWNPVGVALADTPLLGTSALVGTYGLSILVVLIGGALWLALRRAWQPATALAGLVLLIALLPRPSLAPASAGTPARAIRIVQPNIGQDDKWRPGFAAAAAQRHVLLSAAPGSGPRLLFWPEAAVVDPLLDGRTDPRAQIASHFTRLNAAAALGPRDVLLTGGLAYSSSDRINVDGATNSVFALAAGGRILGRYDKAHLVPYGEYLPMRPLLSAIGLSRLAPGQVDFLPGPGPRTLDLPGFGKVGLQICYEMIFSGEVANDRQRPDFIFNPSNDAWFGAWGPPQHLAQARLRAAEEGLPIIRSTPTGISAVIDARGRVLASIPWRQAGRIDATLPPAAAEPTPFARWGNLIPLLLGFALLAAAIALASAGRYRRAT